MQEPKYYNLTNPQKSIWYTEEAIYGTTISNICTSGIIYENVNLDLLKEAINLVVKQNDSFRIHIVKKEGNIKQYISDYKKFDIDVTQINNYAELKEIENEEASKKFDLIDSDLYRFKIVTLKDKFACVILTANHIISDSWSMGITIQQIVKNYHCLLNNQSVNSSCPSYIDYINSEKAYNSSSKFKKDKNYWNDVFKTIPEKVTIPSYKKNTISYKANRLSFDLDKHTVDAITNFCKIHKISILSFFMAVYSIYIWRISEIDDFVIGTPILNRTNVKEKNTMGMFVNTAPIRINNIDSVTFVELASSISEKMMGVLRHQKYSYNSILEDIKSQNLYSIMLSYQVTKAFDKNIGNYKTNWTFNNYCANNLDIHIYDINDTGSLVISYDYQTAKYDENDLNNMHNRIVDMIYHILNNSDILTNDINIITQDEKCKLLYDFNNTDSEYPKDKTIIDLFEEQVTKTPNNTAIVFKDNSLTYKELNAKANSLANYLKRIGINKFDKVSIMLDKGVDLIVSILAVLKLDACYIPIAPEYPKERILNVLNDSNSKLLLSSTKYGFKNCLNIENIDSLNTFSKKNLSTPISANDLAYIIYTSGSTGKPKGVTIAHSSLLNYIYWASKFYCNHKPTNFPLYSSIGFDLTITSIFTPLICGGTIIVYKADDIFLTLKDIFERSKSDIVKLTPAHMSMLNEFNFSKTNVKKLIVGGDLLSPELCKKVSSKFKNIQIYNEYGPTEATVGCMIYKYSKESNIYNSVPIGIPIDNTQIYLLDKDLNSVPLGFSGELYISGVGLSKGYLNNSELTSKNFIPNPFSPNTLMYKTGDIGVFNSYGNINCLGRSDNQVKIRGFRIELGEIEDKILEVPNVGSCVVIKRSNLQLHDFLCAYFTGTADIDDIKKYLNKFLPKYMIPAHYVKMEVLPYTTNGKVDRKALPDPQIQNLKKEITPARNDIDAKLIQLLQSLLKIAPIGINDDFFELGGDSLSAINLCAQIQSNFKVHLLVKDIMENPKIADLSDILSSRNQIEQPIIEPIPKSDFYAVSSSQKRMYFSSQMINNNILYNTPGGVILDGKIDANLLENCFNTLIERHESLRTYFELNNETVVQKVLDSFNFKLKVVDNCHFENLNDLYKNFVKPFDLSQAPLLRAQLIQFTNGKSAIFVDMHHIISDGVSLSIFTDELCKLYDGKTLPKLEITYKDYAKFENERISNGEDYWLKQFEGEIPVLNMPTTHIRPAIQAFEGKKLYKSIDTYTIDKLANELGVTPYVVLLSCYYILLSKYTSQDDIIIGSPIVGRDLEQIQNVIGMFVNTLALRNTVNSNSSFKEFAKNIMNNVLKAYENQTYPFDELINKLNIKKDISRNPLFDTMFVYQNNGYKNIYFNGIKAEYYIPDTNISKFDLSLEAIPNGNNINLNFEYATSLFDDDFICNLANHYLNIINSVSENTDIKIADIYMISNEEKNRILYEFNNTFSEYPKDKTIVELFEEQVLRVPNNVAVVFENQKLTYKELNERANSLANYLKEQNITNNDVVSILLNRSLDLIIAIYGVIKSGASYVLIDTSFPKDRIDYIIKDCKSSICITENELNSTSINMKKFDFSKYNNKHLNTTSGNNLCIIYTSGSTGNPKGVLLHQQGFINLMYSFDKEMQISSFKNILGISTVSFDMFAVELFSSTLFGNTLVLANEEEQRSPISMSNLIKNNNIDFFVTTPSRVELLLSKECENPLKHIKAFQLGGEKFTGKLFDTIINYTNAKIFNGYGPTEITACCLNKFVSSNDITIGKPISNVQAYICDTNMNLLPIGLVGEICISGVGVANGYLNNENETKKHFIKNPFGNGYLYKTGDLGKFRKNGEIEIIGRMDNQVKIRGLRIELSEVENYILHYPGIKNSAVVKQNVFNHDTLCAYYISDLKINVADLRKYLSNILPIYMVPSYFIAIEHFPYTRSGKIDTKSLPLPNGIMHNENYVPPQTSLEKDLVDIWKKVLRIKNIGINDNFFEIGGDSILAMNLNIELLKISNKIKYSDIFNHPTIAQLEEFLYVNDRKPIFNKIEDISGDFVDVLAAATKKSKIMHFHPKNILLTGATGFLGIHILDSFLSRETGNIYCLVRKGGNITSKEKLCKKLQYYFGDKYIDLIDKRIFVVTGNILKPNFGLSQKQLESLSKNIDTVINCAANVSHFGNYDDFYNSNVKSVQLIVDFCKNYNKKLYHVSTTSISGSGLDLSLLYKKIKKNKLILNESKLYMGQIIDNVYARTKFEAESIVLHSIANGLDGYILRMGNLMPRYSDGVFQENVLTNSFISKIISFIKIGIVPKYLLMNKLEFTPVDCAANAIFNVVTNTTKNNRIFHLYNHHNISVKKFIKSLQYNNFSVSILGDEEFKKRIKLMLSDNSSKNLLKNLIDDFDNDLNLNYKIDIMVKSKYTIKYLKKTGFKWPKINSDYLNRFINLLRKVI